MTKRRNALGRLGFAALLVAVGLLPAVTAARHAFADDEESPADAEEDTEQEAPKKAAKTPAAKKRKIALETLATDEAALINVTGREMPASPDIVNVGRKGARALARCVSDNVDDNARVRCAEILGRLGDRAGLAPLQGALEAWNVKVRRAAIDALARIPDPSSVEPLKKIIEREDEQAGNVGAALATLGALSDTRAMTFVREVFHRDQDKKHPNVRAEAFDALWKSRHLMARSTLVRDVRTALESDDAELVLSGTFAASELREPELREPLIKLMTNADAHIRNRGVYAIGKIGDKKATSVLLEFVPKVRESRMLNNIAFALERLDPPAFFATAKTLSASSQAQIRMNTAFVLGDVKRPEGLPMLRAALGDKNDAVRLSAVNAIGRIDAKDGIAALEKYEHDPNPTLKKAAIYAIFALSGMKRAEGVRELYDKGKPDEKLEAAIALGRAGDQRVAGDLMACLETKSCDVAEVGGFLRTTKAPYVPGRTLLAWTRGRGDLTELLSTLRPPGTLPIAVADAQASVAQGALGRARTAIDVVGDVGDPQAVLRPLLTHGNTRLRLHAATALARTGDAEALRVLFTDVDNLPHERLAEVVRVLGRVHEAPARAAIGAELAKREKGADPVVALACAAVRFRWDPEVGVFRMLKGLASKGRNERDQTERYLRADKRPVVTSLLRRALAREKRPDVRDTLRRLLDVRDGQDER